ncbi:MULTISPECIES: TolC family protein [Dehalobacter]|uniref:Outer membrane efflux protein n=1 Tax=Dehalobacter restrictus TaxID=55583 RepID=A0A857DJK9_9FIRM|nr:MULTISPECIES: TolC family protein [Dehalobacter]MDJ0306602.1 TolC family protein [Dehalobacter sp.]QHA01540.1 hypothetical protein GQ588_13270 [Dehalobacter restrictus]
MHKKAYIIVLILVLVLIVPYTAFADTDDDDDKLVPINTLEFNEIEDLMLARNPVIKGNMKSFSDSYDGKNKGITVANDYLSEWNAKNIAFGTGDGTNPKDEAAIAYLLNAQKNLLLMQKASYESGDSINTIVNIQKGNNSLIWGVENLYISYNTLITQLEDSKAKQSLAERQVKIIKIQKDLGMATELDVAKAENTLSELEMNIQRINVSQKATIQQLNVSLAQDNNTELTVKKVPEVTAAQMLAIDPDADYLIAKTKSYDIQIDSSSDDSQRKFKNSFYQAYQTVLDKQRILDIEQRKLLAVESEYKTAQLSYKLGKISLVQFESTKCTFISQQTAIETAKNTLAVAYRAYEWAKLGLIVNSAL